VLGKLGFSLLFLLLLSLLLSLLSGGVAERRGGVPKAGQRACVRRQKRSLTQGQCRG
jgi:hypothetical protein